MKWLLAFVLLGVSQAAALAQAPAPPPPIYTVIFDVTTDAAGKIDIVKVVRVMDPRKRGAAAVVNTQPPPSYIAATREMFRQQTYKPGEHFYTSNAFDPARPTEARIAPPDPD